MQRAIPILPITDPGQAKQFYVEALGFRIVFEAQYPHPPDGGTILGVEREGLRIHLDCPMPGHGRDACVYLEVEDADALYDEWRPGVDIAEPPRDQPWGQRTFTMMDPFGNSLFVVGPLRPDRDPTGTDTRA
jgi:uncharacterized glyoxalase superfamily protein PhnB